MTTQTWFGSRAPGDAVAITKSDSTVVAYWGIYVGGTGDVTIKGKNGVAVTFSAVPVGTILPVYANRVMSTGTTATLMVGFTA